MAKQKTLPSEELARRAGAIKSLALSWVVGGAAAGVVCFIAWLFNPSLPVVLTTVITGIITFASLFTWWLNRIGQTRTGGYFFVAWIILLAASVTFLIGGATGPLAVTYVLPILMAGMTIGIGAVFTVATLVVAVFIAVIVVEHSGVFAQFVVYPGAETVPAVLTITAYITVFYLVAFLSWYASSRLHQALQKVSIYAAELQTSNEKLQASEEELRTTNEELEASNEELRATEEELRASNEELTATNEELKDAQERVIRTEKLAAIGQLAGGVGHELRNPLGAIKNAVYYIRGKLEKSDLTQKEPRVMEFLGIVDDEINSSNKIISDLLNFSRVGKPAASPARIEKVISDAIAHVVVPENIVLDKAVANGLPDILIDTDLIRQVFINLLTNAVQAMPEGGKVSVSARNNDNFMELTVADTGTGIKPENMKKLFDPLFTTKAKGIGLGLAVCKSIIERHQGRIEVASEVGKGTTFTIRLPLNTK